MAVWTDFTYDDPIRSYRRGERWVPTGDGKPAILYLGDGDWAGRAPGDFYDPTTGEDFFLNQISPKEGTNPVAVFSAQSSSAAYDKTTTSATAWATSTVYAAGDLVTSGGSTIFRCVEAHTSGATTEPAVGADWLTRWYVCDEQEVGDHMLHEARHRTPAFRESGVLDLAALFAHVVENAATYGVDVGQIFVMGRGAGAQAAGCFAYDLGDPYSPAVRPVLGVPTMATNRPKPAGAILYAGPDDWKDYPWGAPLQNLFGRVLTTQWADMPDARKSALSPLGVLRSTGDSVPTFLAYGGQGFFNPATDVPPYSSVDIGHARNGYQIFQRLVATLAQSDVTFVEDHPSLSSTYNVWTTAGGASSPASTIPDTDEDDELWTWFQALSGA